MHFNYSEEISEVIIKANFDCLKFSLHLITVINHIFSKMKKACFQIIINCFNFLKHSAVLNSKTYLIPFTTTITITAFIVIIAIIIIAAIIVIIAIIIIVAIIVTIAIIIMAFIVNIAIMAIIVNIAIVAIIVNIAIMVIITVVNIAIMAIITSVMVEVRIYPKTNCSFITNPLIKDYSLENF